MKSFYLLVLVTIVFGKPAIQNCPRGFNYSVHNSCFKYDDNELLNHQDAEQLCLDKYGGRLAILDTHLKMKKTIEFFRTIFDDEVQKDGGKPTAWVGGKRIENSRHVRYDSGEVNKHPHWMTVYRKGSNDLFRWPTSIYGDDANCLVVALWRKESPSSRTSLYSGHQNIFCNLYYTYPLCEVRI